MIPADAVLDVTARLPVPDAGGRDNAIRCAAGVAALRAVLCAMIPAGRLTGASPNYGPLGGGLSVGLI